MVHRGVIGHDRRGPVAESFDAGALHCSLSWFESRPGLQPLPLRGFGSASQPRSLLRPRLPKHSSEGGAKTPAIYDKGGHAAP